MLTPRKVTDVTYVIPHGQHQAVNEHDPFIDGCPRGITMPDLVRASLLALPDDRKL